MEALADAFQGACSAIHARETEMPVIREFKWYEFEWRRGWRWGIGLDKWGFHFRTPLLAMGIDWSKRPFVGMRRGISIGLWPAPLVPGELLYRWNFPKN